MLRSATRHLAFHLNTTFITGDLEKLGEAMTDMLDTLPKTTTFLVSWIAYAGFQVLLGPKE